MAAIYPSARGWVDTPRVANDKAVGLSSRRLSDRTFTWTKTSQWQKLLQRPDIANCIVTSKLRCIFTLVSLTLLVTDIPRTGLGVRNLREFYPVPLMPSTAVRFGPFDYPIAHIWRLENGSNSGGTSPEFAGVKGDQPISGPRVWPYKHDTLSIALRGAVEMLNVTDFPSFLLYKPQPNQPLTNADSLIDLSTAFNMLDAFIAAALDQLTQPDGTRTTLRYATKHNWVDRIHHYVVRFASKNPAWRLHSLHAPRIAHDTRSLAICSSYNAAGIAHRSSPRPRFCNHPGIWKCKNPIDKSLPAVRLWEHMDLRLQTLQQQYPDLELDVALVSSQRLSSTSGVLRSSYFSYEALESTVLTRGRRCLTNASSALNPLECMTIFVDDYRYERDIVQTNLVDWYDIISFLRGGAQSYVWLRLVLLVYGASIVARESPLRLLATVSILFKIPFEVIVYSSLLPVSGYVVAQLLDSSFMDIFLDSYWAAVGGSIRIDLVTFLRSTAVQMRNVWLLALLASLVVFAVRRRHRDYRRDGIPAIRGLAISFTSTLTVFGPYKSTTYRDTDIIDLFRVADPGKTMDIVHSNSGGNFNISTYFFDDSAVMLTFCVCVVVGLALSIKLLVLLKPHGGTAHHRDLILSTTPIIPCGTQKLWLMSVLSIQFWVRSRASAPRSPVSTGTAPALPITPLETKVRPFHSQPLARLPSVKFFSRKTVLGDVDCSSTEFRSILQLMNIALMTDPWNLFWLRVLGVQLYLYRIRATPLVSAGNVVVVGSSYNVLLPYAEDEMEGRTGLATEDFELLDSASSRDVPMSVLLLCG